MKIDVRVARLPGTEDLPLPAYQTSHAAGMDIVAAEECLLAPGERRLVSTGLVLEIPDGFEAQVRPRSGLAVKYGVTLLNTPGTIDADYRGEIRVLMINLGASPFSVARGDRIAQMVFAPVTTAQLALVTTVGETERGAGGFGSTGR